VNASADAESASCANISTDQSGTRRSGARPLATIGAAFVSVTRFACAESHARMAGAIILAEYIPFIIALLAPLAFLSRCPAILESPTRRSTTIPESEDVSGGNAAGGGALASPSFAYLSLMAGARRTRTTRGASVSPGNKLDIIAAARSSDGCTRARSAPDGAESW
jgi:hypothetical protein